MRAGDLTEKQKEEFAEIFYDEFWPSDETDCDTGYPWGCPWCYDTDLELGEGSMREMVERFFRKNEQEILDLMAEDAEREEEEE